MAADAEAELRVLVQHLARAALFRRQVTGDELLVEQRLRHEAAHRLFAGRAGVDLQDVADVSAELFEGIGHRCPPFLSSSLGCALPAMMHRTPRGSNRPMPACDAARHAKNANPEAQRPRTAL